MPRPALPKLARGDTLFMFSGTPGRREGCKWSEVRVTGVGPKYVTVIATDRYEAFLADPVGNRYWTRKFLIKDQVEGEPGKRIGYSARIATREQAEWDTFLVEARAYLNDTLGLVVRSMDSPLANPDKLMAFVAFLKLALPQVLPEIEAEPRDHA